MKFGELLDDYLYKLRSSAKELSDKTGLSAATISRYKSGERIPDRNGEKYKALIQGLSSLAEEKNVPGMTVEELEKRFNSSFDTRNNEFDFDSFRVNFSQLMDGLHMSMKEIADCTGKDISYISRIRSGTRKPGNPYEFITDLSKYVLSHYLKKSDLELMAELMDCRSSDLVDTKWAEKRLFRWLFYDDNSPRKYVESFIHSLDVFNINEYADNTSLKEIKKVELPKNNREILYGFDKLEEAEDKFLSIISSSDKTEKIDIFWDMPDVRSDMNSYVMKDMAHVISKGVNIRIIHANDTPMIEMMNWLKEWMPIYMSGHIESYYLNGDENRRSVDAFVVSDSAVLHVDGVSGRPDIYRSIITTAKDEVEYYKKKFEGLVQTSGIMIDVIRDKKERDAIMSSTSEGADGRKSLLSTPPIYTISTELLERILKRNKIPSEDRKKIHNYIKDERKKVLKILKKSKIEDHIPDVNEDDFKKRPIFLSLSGLFYDKDIFYTYEEYQEHMDQARKMQKDIPNYSLVMRPDINFRNIQIFVQKGEWVLISKNKTPVIHYLISHPVIRQNLENILEAYN